MHTRRLLKCTFIGKIFQIGNHATRAFVLTAEFVPTYISMTSIFVLPPATGNKSHKYRKYCCLPLWLWLVLSLLSTLTLATLMVVRRQHVHNVPNDTIVRQSTNAPREVTTRTPDSHMVQEYLINVSIVCAVLSTFSGLALLTASIPSIFRLIHGRPFQRRKQINPYGETGKLNEPQFDGCYGTDAARCDPVSCMRLDIRENGMY